MKDKWEDDAMDLLEHHSQNWQRTIISDEKMWYAHPPMNGFNDRFWTAELKRDVPTQQIIRPTKHYGPAVGFDF
jgi:hypothetical protein